MSEEPGKKRDSPAPEHDEGDNDRPTISPPFDVEAYARATAASRLPADPAIPDTKSRQITATNEVELERARAQSARLSEPPRHITMSALSIADARAQSSPSIPQIESPPPVAGGSSSIEAAVLDALGSQPPPEISERTIEDPVAEMRERFSLGDYTGALEMSELILADDPGNLEAAECGENSRSVLEGMFAARLGRLDRVPMIVVPRTQMRWLSIDHRSGFILSLVDGSSTVEMILDVCGMPKLDALRILHELVQQKIVAFR